MLSTPTRGAVSAADLGVPETFNAAVHFVDRNVDDGRGGSVAIEFGDRRITYAEVQSNVNRFGSALRDSLGVRLEERVLLLLLDTPEFAYAFFGAMKIGAVPIPTNTLWKSADYEYDDLAMQIPRRDLVPRLAAMAGPGEEDDGDDLVSLEDVAELGEETLPELTDEGLELIGGNSARALDPDKDLRTRVADVEACGSVENRILLARECMEQGMHADAATLYKSCLTGIHETDPHIRYGLAAALLADGKHSEALATAQRLRASHPTFRINDVGLVLARALEGANRLDEALAEFGVLADTYPGEEGRWRYGALLARLGRAGDAHDVFRRMLRNAERKPAHYRAAQKSWLDLAREGMQT